MQTVFLALLLGFLAATPARAADTIAPQLRAQVEKARPNLGDLPAWQEEIFQNEVLPSSGRFIRDYKTAGGQVTKADVDLEGIKRYLAFTSTQILKPDSNKILLFVRTNSACTECAKPANLVRADLKERLERRGLVVLPATADEMRHDPSEAYSKRNAAGWVLAEIRAEDDPDHPGDSRYSLLLDFHFPGTVASNVLKQMEILPSDSIEVSMSRLAIDAILEIGAKARTAFAAANVESPGVEVALDGVTAFSMVTQVKSKLQAAIGNDYRVVEKRIERGRASLSVLAGSAADARSDAITALVGDQLKKIVLDGFTVQITNVGTERVDLKVIPVEGKGSA
ncbi:MAG: hypothetical protein JST04_04095 [Bdellovibrionales bacterium]|nr:hypothetical protein [Bdellovibrionales bacterium]